MSSNTNFILEWLILLVEVLVLEHVLLNLKRRDYFYIKTLLSIFDNLVEVVVVGAIEIICC